MLEQEHTQETRTGNKFMIVSQKNIVYVHNMVLSIYLL